MTLNKRVDVRDCFHGERRYIAGVGKDGRSYSGWFCPERDREVACKPIWDTQQARCKDLEWNPGFDLLWKAPSDCCTCPEIISWGSPTPIRVVCQNTKQDLGKSPIFPDEGSWKVEDEQKGGPMEWRCLGCGEGVGKSHSTGCRLTDRVNIVLGSHCQPNSKWNKCSCYVSPYGGRVPLTVCPVHGWEMDLSYDPTPAPESSPTTDIRKANRYSGLAIGSFVAGLFGMFAFTKMFDATWAAFITLAVGFVLASIFASHADKA